MPRVEGKSLDWTNPVQAGADWVSFLVPHWEVILEAFGPYRGDVLAERAITACEEMLEERPEPTTPAEANVRFRAIRDYAKAQVDLAKQRAAQQARIARVG